MVKLDVHVFSKAAWVVILQSFGISKSLGDKKGDKTILKSCFSPKMILTQQKPWHTNSRRWPQARDWREAVCLEHCSEVWCLDSWQRRIAIFSWRPLSCLLRSLQRSGWSGCWTQTAWCGRRCLPEHNWKYSDKLNLDNLCLHFCPEQLCSF